MNIQEASAKLQVVQNKLSIAKSQYDDLMEKYGEMFSRKQILTDDIQFLTSLSEEDREEHCEKYGMDYNGMVDEYDSLIPKLEFNTSLVEVTEKMLTELIEEEQLVLYRLESYLEGV